MNTIISIIILIIIVIISFKVFKRNFKNRTDNLNNNLIEYCYDIIKKYDTITFDKQHEFKRTLTSKELDLLNRLIIKDINLGNSLNILQTQMLTLESIMQKLNKYLNTNNYTS